MFNEGVDVPLVDTVMMLRPTESVVIWMQQLGRGLRVAEGKSGLVVIDYIGNHRAFLTKLGGLADLLGREEAGRGAMRDLLEAIRSGRIALPPGCEITYDLEARNILDALLEPTRTAALLEAFYLDFLDRHDRRPTALEAFHAGFSPRANAERGWAPFVARMGGFGASADAFAPYLPALGKLQSLDLGAALMLRALLTLASDGAMAGAERIARELPAIAQRSGVSRAQLPIVDADGATRVAWIRDDAVPLLLDRLRGPRIAVLRRDGDAFGFAHPCPEGVPSLVGEIADWRIAEQIGAGRDLICNVQRNTGGDPILFLPSGTAGTAFPRGDLDAMIDGQRLMIWVRKIAIGKVVAKGTRQNLLPAILRRWFGDDAGKPGTGFKVWLRRRGDLVSMEPVSLARAAERDG